MPEPETIPDNLQRYSRQIRFPPLGLKGQQRLSRSAMLLVGCGALGSVIADLLVRAGVGRIRIVDRDFPEWHNLQRQVLYSEADVEAGLPKAVVAASRLAEVNSSVAIEPVVADLNHGNIGALAANMNLVVDGTDNFETRFLINDYALESGTPWIYGGCLGAEGQTMTIIPGETPCLHCLMSDGPPPPGTTPGCDTAGIVGPVVNLVAALQSMEAIKLLSGNAAAVNRDLTVVDLWSGRLRHMNLDRLSEQNECPACQAGRRAWLSGEQASRTAVLCGRDAVQIRGQRDGALDLEKLARRLRSAGEVRVNPYLLKLELVDCQMTVFADGRAIIQGTDDVARARSLYARWVGN